MKRHIRDGIVWLLAYSGMGDLYRWYVRRRGPLVRVLCFHDVNNHEHFFRVVEMLSIRYHILTPLEFHSMEFDLHRINILITFDDGYRSWVDVAAPILEQFQSRGIFFVASGLLAAAENADASGVFMEERLLISPRSALSFNDAHVLISRGHTLGGHTKTHPSLVALSDMVASHEISDDKMILEHELATVLTDFAYPFGTRRHIHARHASMAQEAGYTFVYTAEPGFFTGDTTRIPRTLIDEDQSIASIVLFIEGAYDLFSRIKYLCVR